MPDFLRVNGRLHHFRFRAGDGARALVFANSLGTDLRIWDSVIDRLPPDVPVLTYDKAGHGLSEGGAVTIPDFASDLAALMDAIRLSDALICGVSVGGMIAQVLAAERPDLVAGLVLCNTSHRIGSAESWAERIDSLDETGLEAMADGVLERWFAPGFQHEHPDLVSGYRIMLTRTPEDGYRTVCAAIRDTDLGDSTSRLACPTLCIAGTEDQATPPEIVEATANVIPEADYTCLNGVGHLPCIEVPDQLAALLCERLEALV
ncbi:3-oxoadipate enol-lactonase [uncultured Ruegeria sp.]|uniref:3-oxoadipate enol-lactonase n=1 Tax=uncultured Ruegeria sp. TaxID=259304 RepID=UPI002612BBBB|nr:3-oxoadipate enol-lactonase [uncultured Ruegeria sp.]